jgi:hypothetical protein
LRGTGEPWPRAQRRRRIIIIIPIDNNNSDAPFTLDSRPVAYIAPDPEIANIPDYLKRPLIQYPEVIRQPYNDKAIRDRVVVNISSNNNNESHDSNTEA